MSSTRSLIFSICSLSLFAAPWAVSSPLLSRRDRVVRRAALGLVVRLRLDGVGLLLVLLGERHLDDGLAMEAAAEAALLLRDVGQLVGEQRLTGGARHRLLGRVAHQDHAGAADGHGVRVALAVELLGELAGEDADVAEVDAELALVAVADASARATRPCPRACR